MSAGDHPDWDKLPLRARRIMARFLAGGNWQALSDWSTMKRELAFDADRVAPLAPGVRLGLGVPEDELAEIRRLS